MGKQFQDIGELANWIQLNRTLGTHNGDPVFSPSRKEFRTGFITGELYNTVLKIARTLGYNKSEVGTSAIELFNLTEQKVIDQYVALSRQLRNDEFTTEFRFNYPVELLPSHLLTKDSVWSNSLFISVCLSMWCDKHLYSAEEKIEHRAKELGITVEKCVQLIFDSWLLESRKRRLALSKKQGRLVRDRKV